MKIIDFTAGAEAASQLLLAELTATANRAVAPSRVCSGSATVGDMLRAADLLLLARRTAGFSQAELGARLGRPRSTIARWELGEMQPPYDAVRDVIAACGLDVSVELVEADPSYLYEVGEQLRRPPLERVRRLGGDARARAVMGLARSGTKAVVIGDAAGALQGWPLMLPSEGPVEVCAPATASVDIACVAIVAVPPGTRGYADLRRGCERVLIDGDAIEVASPLDLLRIERARGHGLQASALEAVLEHRRRWPDGPPTARGFTDDQAREAIEAWLTRR